MSKKTTDQKTEAKKPIALENDELEKVQGGIGKKVEAGFHIHMNPVKAEPKNKE